jgi:hypothetical protein
MEYESEAPMHVGESQNEVEKQCDYLSQYLAFKMLYDTYIRT